MKCGRIWGPPYWIVIEIEELQWGILVYVSSQNGWIWKMDDPKAELHVSNHTQKKFLPNFLHKPTLPHIALFFFLVNPTLHSYSTIPSPISSSPRLRVLIVLDCDMVLLIRLSLDLHNQPEPSDLNGS